MTSPWNECPQCHTDKPGTQRGCTTCAIFAAGVLSSTTNVTELVEAARGALKLIEHYWGEDDASESKYQRVVKPVEDALRTALERLEGRIK